jgi:hypothetical protein
MKLRDILTIVHQYWILFLLTNEHFVKHYSFVLIQLYLTWIIVVYIVILILKKVKLVLSKNVSGIIKLLISIAWIQLLVMHGSIRLVYLVASFISCVRLYTVDKLKRFIPRLLPQWLSNHDRHLSLKSSETIMKSEPCDFLFSITFKSCSDIR